MWPFFSFGPYFPGLRYWLIWSIYTAITRSQLGRDLMEDEGKQEEKFEFTPEGEALGYISLDQARVLAMGSAREAPGGYGRRFRNVPMAFDVAEAEETEDYYVITLSYCPQGEFAGRPGQEQFFIEKEGTVAHRQVLSLPSRARWWRSPVGLVSVGIVVVVAVAVGGLIASIVWGESDDGAPLAAASPTRTPESLRCRA